MKKSRGKHLSPRPGRSRKELPEKRAIITFLNNPGDILLDENKRRTASFFIIAFVVFICLLPFANRAFNIDDPLFIWTAKQIQIHPADFYGFQVNWYGTEMPMYEIQKNPPLVSYYIALIMSLFGSGEIVLHIAFLLPSIATALGIYSLARKLCSQPLLATLISIMTPAFLVSSNTIMCDLIMLFFWVWAVFFWIQGLETNKKYYLLCSGIFVSLSFLSKYYGICLVPLLFVYAFAKERSLGRWVLHLFIPLLVVGLYCWVTHLLYGYAHFFDIFSYAKEVRNLEGKDSISKTIIGLAFAGGGFFSVLFFWPFLWRKATAVWIILIVLFSAFLAATPTIGHLLFEDMHLALIVQIATFMMVGLSLLFLAIDDLFKHKNPAALFIFLWVLGTLIFAFFINWTVNIRTILPVVPVLGILVMRRIESKSGRSRFAHDRLLIYPLLISTILSLSIVWADYCFANSSQKAARLISDKYISGKENVWFQGHWGFQYYMEKSGGKPIDFKQPIKIAEGDIIVIPSPNQNTNIIPPPKHIFNTIETIQLRDCNWISIMNYKNGAGFYSSMYGSVPFAFGPAEPETYEIVRF